MNGATAPISQRRRLRTSALTTASVMPPLPLSPVSTPVASTTISCSFMRSPSTSPTISPLRMTRMRWQTPISSAISEEITITERPSAARAAMKRYICCLAPMSTPRVGSSMTTTFGSSSIILAISSFC